MKQVTDNSVKEETKVNYLKKYWRFGGMVDGYGIACNDGNETKTILEQGEYGLHDEENAKLIVDALTKHQHYDSLLGANSLLANEVLLLGKGYNELKNSHEELLEALEQVIERVKTYDHEFNYPPANEAIIKAKQLLT